MSKKPVFPCALLLALSGVGALWAQDYTAPPGPPPGTPRPVNMTPTDEMPPLTDAGRPPSPLDKWMTFCCPDCCGPVGGNGPIKYDLFIRSGPRIPVAGGAIFGTTSTGWEVEGGGRSLFVDCDPVRAWSVSLSIDYSYNAGNKDKNRFLFPTSGVVSTEVTAAGGSPVPFVLVSTAALQRTECSAEFGREWWLIGSANSCSCGGLNWRAGLDAGFRYGVARLDLHDFNQPPVGGFGSYQRTTSTCYGPEAALHTDAEYPCGCCTFIAGLRAEFDYSRMNVIPLLKNDVYEVNLLLNLGVRY